MRRIRWGETQQDHHCGGGLAPEFVALALTAPGYDDVAVYDGSRLEWAADPELPLV